MTIGVFDRSPCDAMQFGSAPSMVDGHCTCLVCDRCGHHTGNSMYGHYGYSCKILVRLAAERRRAGEEFTMQEFVQAGTRDEPHFCCPDTEHGCEYEHERKEDGGQASPA